MSEVREGGNLGGGRFSGETAPLRSIRRKGTKGPRMTGHGLIDGIEESDNIADELSSEQQDITKPLMGIIKERKKRTHPYNIPQGTATWSGPYGKDGTVRLEDVPANVVAYPVYKEAYSGALTMMVEVDSPPELKGRRFQVAKPLRRTGWYR